MKISTNDNKVQSSKRQLDQRNVKMWFLTLVNKFMHVYYDYTQMRFSSVPVLPTNT